MSKYLIPVKLVLEGCNRGTEIQKERSWIPASAGMTVKGQKSIKNLFTKT